MAVSATIDPNRPAKELVKVHTRHSASKEGGVRGGSKMRNPVSTKTLQQSFLPNIIERALCPRFQKNSKYAYLILYVQPVYSGFKSR